MKVIDLVEPACLGIAGLIAFAPLCSTLDRLDWDSTSDLGTPARWWYEI
jgi:hypothetical protein